MWDSTALRRIALVDQVKDEERPWTYTCNCPMCGGVGAFIDYLEEVEESFDSLDLLEDMEGE